MPITLISPMNESLPAASAVAARLKSLSGKAIALLDISKPGGSLFLDRVEQLLRERYGVATVMRAMKPTFAKPAPAGVMEEIQSADAVIEGLAD